MLEITTEVVDTGDAPLHSCSLSVSNTELTTCTGDCGDAYLSQQNFAFLHPLINIGVTC